MVCTTIQLLLNFWVNTPRPVLASLGQAYLSYLLVLPLREGVFFGVRVRITFRSIVIAIPEEVLETVKSCCKSVKCLEIA